MSKTSSKKENEKSLTEGIALKYSAIPQYLIGFSASKDNTFVTVQAEGAVLLDYDKAVSINTQMGNDNNKRIAKLEREIALLRKSLLFKSGVYRPANYRLGIKKAETKIKYRIESPFTNNNFDVIFEKNKYIESEESLWKIIYIINDESFFKNTLEKFNFIINKDFIEFLFQNSIQNFYIDQFSHKISTTKISNSYYEEISLSELLEFLNIDKIENLIEKGAVFYE